MKLRRVLLLLITIMIAFSGCKDRLFLEDVTLVLMVGFDLDKDNNLIVYSSSPVFNKEAKEKNEVTKVTPINIKDARNELEERVSALISSGKIQNVLISKRILAHEGWFALMDSFYRDPRTSETARVIAVDGSVEDIIRSAPKNKRRLPMHIAKLLDTANEHNLAMKTTLFDLHRQMFEKGITPYLTVIRKPEEDIVATGSLLLNKKGKYAFTLDHTENQFLQMLQNMKKGPLTLSIELPEEKTDAIFNTGTLSFFALQVKRKLAVSYEQNKFHFDIHFTIPIHLTEKHFTFDIRNEAPKLEAEINQQLEKQMKALIAKIQEHEIDPIGLGLYARGYQYKAWEGVQDDWGHALSEAEVNIHIHTEIKNMGETI